MSAQSNLIDLNDKEETVAPPVDMVTDLHHQINKMTSKEKEQLAKELAEEEDFPSAWSDQPWSGTVVIKCNDSPLLYMIYHKESQSNSIIGLRSN